MRCAHSDNRIVAICFLVLVATSSARAGQQERPADPPSNPADTVQGHSTHQHPAPETWTIGVDGVVFAGYDHQGGQRGESRFVSQNWIMAMGSRSLGRGALTFSGMMTAEPVTVGSAGYPELLQE